MELAFEVYKQFMDEMNHMAVITDVNSCIIYANKAFMDETGYDQQVLGKHSNILKSGHHSLVYYSNLYQTLNAGLRWEGRFKNRRKDGSTFFEEAAIFSLELEGITYYCKTAVNTTKKEELVTENQQSIKLAMAIQQSLIKEDLYDETIVIQGKYLPLENVSGDIYNYYHLDDNTYAVFLADVVGHGVGSALLSTTILAIVNDLIYADPSPDVFLKKLNNKIMGLFRNNEMPQTTYFTAAYLIVDTLTMEVKYANCGHPKMYRLSKQEVTDFSKINFFIGMFEDVDYDYETMTVEADDHLLMYSDGLIEMNNDLKNGEKALVDALDAYGKLDKRPDLVDWINDQLIITSSISDDLTLIAITL